MNAPTLAAVALGDKIESLGSYLGIAAMVGLGVLSMLYFAQAREVKRLREWAGRSPERDAELAQRVQSDAQRRVVAQPVQVPRPVNQPASPQTAAAQSADAARKAAAAAVMEKFQQPGTAAGTPAVGPPGQLDRPAAAASGPAASGAGTATPPAPGAPGSSATPGAPTTPGAPATATPAPTPGAPAPTAAAAGAAAAAARQAGPPARTAPFANGAGGQDTHESDAARPAPLPDLPIRPRSAPAPASRRDEDRDASRGPRIGIIAGGVLGVIAIGVVLMLLLNGGGDSPPADNEIGSSTPPPAASKPAASATKVDRKATRIAVLNGTTQTGLARNVGNKLESSGFTILTVGDNADQTITKTTISYADGNEKAAQVVAQIMDLPRSGVKPIDLNTATAVQPDAKVVVVVGSDRSSTG